MPAPTFKARSLTELIDIRAKEQRDDWAVHTGAAEFGDQLQTLTYSQVARSVDRLCHHYKSLQPQADGDDVPPERIVAVLTSTAIDESLLEIALAKLGLAALLLSVNNSTAAVAHLVKQTEASHLIFGPKFEQTAKDAQKALKEEGVEVEVVPEKRFPLWGEGGIDETKVEPLQPRLTPEQEAKRTCVILHSSGSTGFPKPVYITHYGLIANCASSLPKTGFSALPLFHGFGHFSIFRCFYHGKTFTLFPPHIPLTSSNIVRIISSSPTPPEQHFAVPYVLKLLAETEEGTKCLAGFEAVSFAGAAVPDDLGDRLVGSGVNLFSVYGTTETGALLNSRREYNADKAWNWLRVEGPIKDYLQMEPHGSDTYELVVKDGWPAKIMSNRPDQSYATKDLFLQHPDHVDWFKYIGRLDDTLTQTLGEKTNPVPIELAIRGNSPLVQECIVFGDARPQIGALILPSDQAGDIASDKKKYIDAIWPVIEEANARSPSHSRLVRDMIDILPMDTDIPVATKLSILRPACYKKFAPLINDIYQRYESGNGVAKRKIDDQKEMEAFLTEVILEAIGKDSSASALGPTVDLFEFGVDSLQATRVRNTISKSLDLGVEDNNKILGQNIVYEHPSIRQLAEYVLELSKGEQESEQGNDRTHKEMIRMVDNFSDSVLTRNTAKSTKTDQHVVLLTGATGSLGAHILADLVSSSLVAKVICLSRARSHEDSLARVRTSFEQRSRTVSDWSKIESLSADINSDRLGLSSSEYEGLQRTVTAVICNHWPVNFNYSLASFAPHIQGAINLLNLTQTSADDARFYFSSSVGTSQGVPRDTIPETFSSDPATAGGMGYGQSKWVVEKIMERVGEKKGAKVGVFRIGQLVGDSQNGVWNETEAWPLMIKTAQTLRAVPALEERLSWLPVDLAAKAIVEIASSDSQADVALYHIVNPDASRTFGDVILKGLRQAGVDVKPVDRREWLELLGASEEDVERNPGRKLLGFYNKRMGGKEERPFMDFQVTRTSAVSPTIANCPAITESLVELWVKQWRASGFLN